MEGAGAGAGRQRGDLRAITRSGNGAHLAAGVSRPLQSLGSEVVVEGTQGPSLFLGLHEGEVRGGFGVPAEGGAIPCSLFPKLDHRILYGPALP